MFTSSIAQSSEAFNAETERADAMVVEATVCWGEGVLAVRHLERGETLTLGESDDCDVLVAGLAEPIRVEHGEGGVHVLPGAATAMSLDGSVREPAPFELRVEHRAELLAGAFSVQLRVVPAGKAAPLSLADRVKEGALATIGVSFLVHASVVATLAFFMPALGQDDSEALDRDRMYAMKAMLDAAAVREQDRVEEAMTEPSPANQGASSGGGRAQNAEGAMGKPDARTQGHYAAKGNAKPNEVTLARREELAMAKDFGMIALLGTMPTMATASNAPTVPWGTVQNGMDDRDHKGNLWSQELGDAFGFGLGVQGTDEGGGGHNLGIGINDIGGLGRSLDARMAGGTCLAPPCDGMGRSSGALRGVHQPKGPIMRVAKTEVEGGRLAPEVIQRIVRMSHGRFRNCYEAGLRTNPSLGGRVAVRFVIGRDGAVSLAGDGGSDLPDDSVKKCVVQAFYSLSFPAPEGGTVRVTYPLSFTPSE